MRTVVLFLMCLSFLLLRGQDHACAHQNHKNYSHIQFGSETKKQIPSIKKSIVSFDDHGSFAIESEDEDFFVSLRCVPGAFAILAICLLGDWAVKSVLEKRPLAICTVQAYTNTPRFLMLRTIRL